MTADVRAPSSQVNEHLRLALEEAAGLLRSHKWRVEPPLTPENCKHPRRIGTGSMGCDGSSESTTYCPDCGYSAKYSTPPQPFRSNAPL